MKFQATCAIIVATATAAQAQTITVFQSGFEPGEGYAPGNLNGQNGWAVYLGEDPNFGQIVNTNPLAGTQSILLDGADVQLGSFGNYAAIGRATPIELSINGVPLRYIEITGRAAIVDPTLDPSHHSRGDVSLFAGEEDEHWVTNSGAASRQAQLYYGWTPYLLPLQAGVAVSFRHVVDYQTDFATEWVNGQVVYQLFADPFDHSHVPGSTYFEMVSINSQSPFDTRIWFDDVHIKAIYGCAADLNIDFEVNIDDLLAVISAWGACKTPPCAADITGDGVINIDDLLAVIGGWGSC